MDDIIDHTLKILTIIPAIFMVLSVHEFGHYIVAKTFGVHADEYSLGYGKKIFAKQLRNKTSFVLRLFPIGAHVHLNQSQYAPLPFSKKFAIITAGPLFNFILVLPLFFFFFLIAGQPSTPPVFSGIEIGGVADKASIKTNDRIIRANGKDVTRYEQILDLTLEPPFSPIHLTVESRNSVRDITITPEVISYIDIKGLKQNHGRLGVLVRHAPYSLKSIAAVNGKSIPNEDEEQARELILKYLDQYATISFKSTDGSIRDFKAFLDKDLNKNLTNKKHKDFDNFYVGMIGTHFYEPLSFKNALSQSLNQTKDLFEAIIKIPFQLFPLDKEEFKPDETAKDTPLKNWIYKFIFFTAVISIFVGFINLMPIPHFDGGQLLLLLAEKINKNALEPKNKALIITSALLLLYGVISVFNYSDFKTFTNQKFCNAPEWEKQKNC